MLMLMLIKNRKILKNMKWTSSLWPLFEQHSLYNVLRYKRQYHRNCVSDKERCRQKRPELIDTNGCRIVQPPMWYKYYLNLLARSKNWEDSIQQDTQAAQENPPNWKHSANKYAQALKLDQSEMRVREILLSGLMVSPKYSVSDVEI
jgi:hypothetical protein